MNSLATAFRVKRNALGFSRNELASYLNVSGGYIKKIELGKSRPGLTVVETMDYAMDTLESVGRSMSRKEAIEFLETYTEELSLEGVIRQTVAVSKLTLTELLELKKGETKS